MLPIAAGYDMAHSTGMSCSPDPRQLALVSPDFTTVRCSTFQPMQITTFEIGCDERTIESRKTVHDNRVQTSEPVEGECESKSSRLETGPDFCITLLRGRPANIQQS
jgi:hypothetical protein